MIRADLGPCWVWTAGKTTKGYAKFRPDPKKQSGPASRFSWFLAYGQITDPHLFVCHKCDNPECVRPDHFFLGTLLDNARDMAAKGRASRAGPGTPARGERHSHAILTTKDVMGIRGLQASQGLGATAISKLLGLSIHAVEAVLARRTWKHVKLPAPDPPSTPPADLGGEG